MMLSDITREVRRLEAEVEKQQAKAATPIDPHAYAERPMDYLKDVLRIERLWEEKIQEICTALLTPPNRVLVKSSHKTGKSHLAGGLINWFHDSFDPGQLMQIAPTAKSVRDIVWKEVRAQRRRAGLPGLLPKAPEIYDHEEHFAKGMTAGTGEAFQGRHGLKTMAIFDEGTGIDSVFWEAQETIHRPGIDYWIVFLNPTDLTSRAYFECGLMEEDDNGERRPKWHVVTMDAIDHPNVRHAIDRKPGPIPIPAAVNYRQFSGWVSSWCTPIGPDEAGPEALEWPPGSGKWHRQGPVMLARGRGQWPTTTSDAIWTEALWLGVRDLLLPISGAEIPEIGIDVARFGTDYTSFHVRWGRSSMAHESYNGWDGPRILAHAKKLAEEWARRVSIERGEQAEPVKATEIPIKIDEDGLGGIGIVDPLLRDGYRAIGVSAQWRGLSGRYPRMRDELWFQTAERARAGDVAFGRLDADTKERLRQQFMGTGWDLTGSGQCSVWSKDVMRDLIGRSPDDADAANLAYLQGLDFKPPAVIETKQERRQVFGGDRKRRNLFGGGR